jgi:hypothetical protein
MYSWIWRKLPFGFWGKVTSTTGILAATVALLWYVIFPWATPLLPFDDVQVGTGSQTEQGPAQEDPNVVTSRNPAAPGPLPYSTVSNQPAPSKTPTKKTTTGGGGPALPGD